jgi:hypothetical protein
LAGNWPVTRLCPHRELKTGTEAICYKALAVDR